MTDSFLPTLLMTNYDEISSIAKDIPADVADMTEQWLPDDFAGITSCSRATLFWGMQDTSKMQVKYDLLLWFLPRHVTYVGWEFSFWAVGKFGTYNDLERLSS